MGEIPAVLVPTVQASITAGLHGRGQCILRQACCSEPRWPYTIQQLCWLCIFNTLLYTVRQLMLAMHAQVAVHAVRLYKRQTARVIRTFPIWVHRTANTLFFVCQL